MIHLGSKLVSKQTLDIAITWFLGPRIPIPVVWLHQREQRWQRQHRESPSDGDTFTKPPLPPAGNRTRHLHCDGHTEPPPSAVAQGAPGAFRRNSEKLPCHPASSLALPWGVKGRMQLHDGDLGHLPCHPQPREQQPEGSFSLPFGRRSDCQVWCSPFPFLALPQAPCQRAWSAKPMRKLRAPS